jgi:hypothetical protein
MNNKRLITAAAAGAAIASLAPAAAHAAAPGSCQFSAHLQLANGSYSADESTVECAGTIDGQLVHGGGYLQEWGTYSNSGCTLTWRDNTFFARIPKAIAFFGPQYIYSEGGFSLTGPGPVTALSGSGDNNGQPFVEQGVAQFTPDTSGCDVHSGTLTQTVGITDGGDGNPASQAAVSRYQRGGDSGGASGAPAATSTQSGNVRAPKKHHRHHRLHKAHRTLRKHRR